MIIRATLRKANQGKHKTKQKKKKNKQESCKEEKVRNKRKWAPVLWRGKIKEEKSKKVNQTRNENYASVQKGKVKQTKQEKKHRLQLGKVKLVEDNM